MSKRFTKSNRDGGRFLALPHDVINSAAYRKASHAGRSLMIDIAAQYNGSNNGKLVACRKYLEPLGWKSDDVITRRRRELCDLGLLIETRKGMRNNKPSWFALSWYALEHRVGLDIDPSKFERSAYRNYSVSPPTGAPTFAIPPLFRGKRKWPSPSRGSVTPTASATSTPPSGNFVEMPSEEASNEENAMTA